MLGGTDIAEQGTISIGAEVDYIDINDRKTVQQSDKVYPGSSNPKAFNVCDGELMFGYRGYQDGGMEQGWTSFSGLQMPTKAHNVEEHAKEYYLIGVVKNNVENDGIQSNHVAVHKAGTRSIKYNGTGMIYAGDLLMWTLYSGENIKQAFDGKVLGLMEKYTPELPEDAQNNILEMIVATDTEGNPIDKKDARTVKVKTTFETLCDDIVKKTVDLDNFLNPSGKDSWFNQLYAAMIGYNHNRRSRVFAKVLTPVAGRGDKIDVILI